MAKRLYHRSRRGPAPAQATHDLFGVHAAPYTVNGRPVLLAIDANGDRVGEVVVMGADDSDEIESMYRLLGISTHPGGGPDDGKPLPETMHETAPRARRGRGSLALVA